MVHADHAHQPANGDPLDRNGPTASRHVPQWWPPPAFVRDRHGSRHDRGVIRPTLGVVQYEWEFIPIAGRTFAD